MYVHNKKIHEDVMRKRNNMVQIRIYTAIYACIIVTQLQKNLRFHNFQYRI